MTIPAREPYLPLLEGDIPEGYVIYGDQLVLASIYKALRLGRQDSTPIGPSPNITQRVANLQLKVFSGNMDNTDIANWLRHTETCLRVCQVPKSMWVATATRHLSGPAQAWFTTRATDKVEITWEGFIKAAKTRYSGAFAPIVIGTPMFDPAPSPCSCLLSVSAARFAASARWCSATCTCCGAQASGCSS